MKSIRRTSVAILGGLLALSVAGGGVAAAQEAPPSGALSGVLTTVYEDPRPGSGKPEGVKYTLTEDSGKKTGLLVEGRDVEGEKGGLPALDGERVEVVATDAPGMAALEVQEISPDATPPADGTGTSEGVVAQATADGTGAKPTATLLCRFGDKTTITPKGKSHFETLMGATKPGMDYYWREASYGKINLTGSGVYGWYDLPNPESYYKDANGNMLQDRLLQDCTAAADGDVFFPDHTNINVMVNTYYADYALGGTRTLSRDGQNKVYGVAWMPRWGYQKETTVYGGQFILAHEMGHSFGLPHSSGSYADTYDSGWDVMSDGSICSPQDTQFGCLAVHTTSAHKDKLGWIDASRRYTATTAANQASPSSASPSPARRPPDGQDPHRRILHPLLHRRGPARDGLRRPDPRRRGRHPQGGHYQRHRAHPHRRGRGPRQQRRHQRRRRPLAPR